MKECPHCDYSLVGNVSGRCPECGNEIPDGTIVSLLPWESRRGRCVIVRLWWTIQEGAIHPSRVVRSMRTRAGIPIRQTGVFLASAFGVAVGLVLAGMMVTIMLPLLWLSRDPAFIGNILQRRFAMGICCWEVVVHVKVAVVFCLAVGGAALSLRLTQGCARKTLPFKSTCCFIAILFFPWFLAGVLLSTIENVCAQITRTGSLLLGGYREYAIIVAYSVILLVIGLTGLRLNKRWMILASLAYGFTMWLVLDLATAAAAKVGLLCLS